MDISPPRKRPRPSLERLARRLEILELSKEHIRGLQDSFSEHLSDSAAFPFGTVDAHIQHLVASLRGLTEVTKIWPKQQRKDLDVVIGALPRDLPDGTQPKVSDSGLATAMSFQSSPGVVEIKQEQTPLESAESAIGRVISEAQAELSEPAESAIGAQDSQTCG